MRQRKAKDLEKRLQACSKYMIDVPKDKDVQKGKDLQKGGEQQKCFAKDKTYGNAELFLEIGCGKGSFIIKKAFDNPQQNFIAVEGQDTVILRALEKAKAYAEAKDFEEAKARSVADVSLCNLKFMLTFIDNMNDFFEENSLAGIYLNFSDPWPKARHAKRRLTYRKRLADYRWALKPGGFIEIKTDNDDLYDFTLREIDAVGLTVTEQTTDLHSSCYEAKNTTTEYEEKFKLSGKNINYVKVKV